MARLLSLLALVLLSQESHALPIEKPPESCEKLLKYTGMDAGLTSALNKAAQKDFPNGFFNDQCLKAQITPTDKSSAKVTVVYLMECAWQIFSSNPKPSTYKCINENNEKIGNRYYEVAATVSCFGKPNGRDCVVVNTVKDVTPKPSPPSPPPVGKWIITPDIFVPKNIKQAGLKFMMKNAKSNTVAPSQGDPSAFPSGASTVGEFPNFEFSRKIDANGGVTYRVPASLKTQSAAKGCDFPILQSEATVDVKKTAARKYAFSNLTEGKYAKYLKYDDGDKCVGKAAWKAGVAKIEKFCKTAKGGCYTLKPY